MGRPALANAGLLVRTKDMTRREVVDLCMPCHSRRSELEDLGVLGGEPLDSMLPVVLAEGTFSPDGRIEDEDYEYHSFLQSRMCRKGREVQRLPRRARRPALHGGRRAVPQVPPGGHLRHVRTPLPQEDRERKTDAGALCVSCHMPGRNYMVVHFRRDHSLRVPRPDLSEKIGTPNACMQSGCHDDKPLAWSVHAYRKWYGETSKPHYGTVIAAAREHRPEARNPLLQLAADHLRPAIVRATALDLLWAYPGEDTAKLYVESLVDEDTLVLQGQAVEPNRDRGSEEDGQAPGADAERPGSGGPGRSGLAAGGRACPISSPPRRRRTSTPRSRSIGGPSPSRPTCRRAGTTERSWRRTGATPPRRRSSTAKRSRWTTSSTWPGSIFALMLSQQGRNAEAETLLKQALATNPKDPAVAFNLGLLLGEEGKHREAEAALRAALRADSRFAPAAYNLAVLVAEEKPTEAVALSAKAAELDPDTPRYAFTHAYFQARSRDLPGALRSLEALIESHPTYADAYLLLAELYSGQGKNAEAKALLRRALGGERNGPAIPAGKSRRRFTEFRWTEPKAVIAAALISLPSLESSDFLPFGGTLVRSGSGLLFPLHCFGTVGV